MKVKNRRVNNLISNQFRDRIKTLDTLRSFERHVSLFSLVQSSNFTSIKVSLVKVAFCSLIVRQGQKKMCLKNCLYASPKSYFLPLYAARRTAFLPLASQRARRSSVFNFKTWRAYPPFKEWTETIRQWDLSL